MGLTRQLGSQHKRDPPEADDRLQHSNSQEHLEQQWQLQGQ
jgi:hypothetical protein